VLESHAVLIRTPIHCRDQERLGRAAADAHRGVEQVKESKYIMLHAPRSALPAIRRLLPGSEGPTIIPLDGNASAWPCMRCGRENVFWKPLRA